MQLLSGAAFLYFRCKFHFNIWGGSTGVQRLSVLRDTSYTINCEASCQEIVKKSKFITNIAPVASFDDAMRYLNRVKDDKANHNCWAYRSSTTSRCSDDGEPGGTAGRPILGILESEQIIDAIVVVTRHFGGIKLGSGGLVRAYGGAAKAAVLQAGKNVVVPHTIVNLMVPTEDIGSMYYLLQSSQSSQSGAVYKKLSEEFVPVESSSDADAPHSEIHSVQFEISVPTDHIESFKLSIASIFKGKERIWVDCDTSEPTE